MLLTLGLDSLFGALESVTTALQDVRGFGKLRREILSGKESHGLFFFRYRKGILRMSFQFHFSILLSLLNWSIEQTYPYKLYIIEVRETCINQIGMRRREFRCMQMRVTDHERPSQI